MRHATRLTCALVAVVTAVPVAPAALDALPPATPAGNARGHGARVPPRIPHLPVQQPNLSPVVGRLYPYVRFDGLARTRVTQSWTVVELENACLRVQIPPEIGGKIWNAVDKRTGRSFIYHNEIVRFRDVAMRGPWMSGGVEANHGIIGHTPNVATHAKLAARRGATHQCTGEREYRSGRSNDLPISCGCRRRPAASTAR